MGRERRTDPKEIARNREKIEADLEERMHVPQEARRFPNILEKGRRFLQQRIDERREARNPSPRTKGARVIGFKKNNSVV